MSDDAAKHYVDVARRLWAVACILEDVAGARRDVPRGELLAARFEVLRAKWALEKVTGARLDVDSLPRTLL